MPIRFSHKDIERLLRHFRMEPLKKGGNLYGGIGHDGIWRTCKFDYHKGRDIVATGTANVIAKSLGFKNVHDLKEYFNMNLK